MNDPQRKCHFAVKGAHPGDPSIFRSIETRSAVAEAEAHTAYTISGGASMPSARFSNWVNLWRKARGTLPMGPFLCLEMISSARHFKSSRSGL
jgi:hypothetical protein